VPHFFHGPNHHTYGTGSQENSFVPRQFGYRPCPHRGDRLPHRHDSPARGAYSHLEPSRFDGLRFPHCGSRLTLSNCEVHKVVLTSSSHMVKCGIPKIFLTNPSTEPLTFSRSMYMNDGGLEIMWLMDSGCSRYMTGDAKWFSNLTPMQNKEYVTFGDDKKGKVKTNGIIKVNEHLKYKLLSISLVLDDGLEISF
jgi:hypothetical protein